MFVHETRDGRKIKLADLKLSHLENIIKHIENKARNGLTIRYGGILEPDGDIWYDEEWYDEETIFDNEVKVLLHYYDYVEEYNRRVKNLTSHDV